MARYSFRNATDKELTAGLNSSNQDENDAAMKEQMRRLDAGKVPITRNTMDKLATQDPGPKKSIKRSAGGSARGTRGQTSGKNFSGIY
tara:strand:+ start:6221 stop:6484 length:264 start_codon:yes stop_codon:yes gene_type:complete